MKIFIRFFMKKWYTLYEEVAAMKFELIIDPSKEESVLVTAHTQSPLVSEIEEVVKRYSDKDTVIGYLDDSFVILSLAKIECIFVEGGKTYAMLCDGKKYMLKLRLYEAALLLPVSFVKINKSALGRLESIERFKSTVTGAIDAIFKCGHIEYVSRRCFPEIKRRLGK